MLTISFDQRIRAASAVLVKALEDEAVLLHLDTEQYFGLDAVASRMWTLLNTLPSVGAAYAALLDEYDVEPQVLRHDLERMVNELLEHRLLVVDDA